MRSCTAPQHPASHVCQWTLSLLVLALLLAQAAATKQEEVARLYLNSPDKWPIVVRGKGSYTFVLNDRALRRGIHVPETERLRVAMDKLARGENLTISAIGGSVTAGQGAVDAPNWPQYLQGWFNDHYPGKVHVANGAVGGTMSTYMVVCMNVHVPKNADIVFLEYNQNDHGHVAMSSVQRRSFERLVRKLLALPNQPAVVLMNSYSWTMPTGIGLFWQSAERDYNEFARFYGLPSLSVKSAVYHLMAANVSGFNTVPRQNNPIGLREVSFNWDPIHPDGNTGFRCMFELALRLLTDALDSLSSKPLSDSDRMAASAPLPPPMIPNNYPSISDRCFIGTHFTKIVTRQDGFEWKNDAKKGTRLQKFGMIATEVGSVLELTVDARSTAMADIPVDASNQHLFRQPVDPILKMFDDMVQVELAHLASYENMGKANVTCVSGCTCQPNILNGHTTERSSQLTMHGFFVSQSEKCVIRLTVLNESDSGGHKVKVAGLMLSEEAGRHKPMAGHHMAIEYVHHISLEAKDSLFDVKNHVRRLLGSISGFLGRMSQSAEGLAGLRRRLRAS